MALQDKRKNLIKNLLVGAAAGLFAGAVIGGSLVIKQNQMIKSRQERLLDTMNGENSCEAWTSKLSSRFDGYVLTDEEQEFYDGLLSAKSKIAAEDYGNQLSFVQVAQPFETAVQARLETEAGGRLATLKDQDPGYASDEEKKQLEIYATQMQRFIDQGQYKSLDAVESEWSEYTKVVSQKKTGYDITVTQYDLSRYPLVRLYLDIQDPLTGQMVENLSPNMFYVSERVAQSGDFLNRAVQKAVQMNENERLSLNLIADTSGSMMEYGRMDSAKSIMKNFLNTVQFSAGDQVKLTEFNSEIDKTGFFTGDIGQLNNTINGYVPDGQTKLYDAIIYGVQDASGQEGAKCVIAFTDGMDVGSYNSAQNVVDIVSRYSIPVFIVRIGDSTNSQEDGALQQIAEASGGSFKNLSQFSSDMSSFYNEVYRQMKQYYVVEFEADAEDAQAIVQNKEINVYVQNQDKGGEHILSVKPAEEIFDTLLGSYLRSYIIDMNNHKYEQLAQYVDSTTESNDKWSIQWQMKKQVTGGFSNVTAESLMDYSIQEITVQDANTVIIKANENYDVIYDEVYGELKNSERTVAKDALEFLQKNRGYADLDEMTELRIRAKVNQIPQYIVKKGADGKWRFSSYAGDLALGERRKVYDVEVTWEPYYDGW